MKKHIFKENRFKISIISMLACTLILSTISIILFSSNPLKPEELLSPIGAKAEQAACIPTGESCMNMPFWGPYCCGSGPFSTGEEYGDFYTDAMCMDGLCTRQGYNSFLHKVVDPLSAPPPSITPNPDDSECQNRNGWTEVNGFYCSTKDPMKLIYCKSIPRLASGNYSSTGDATITKTIISIPEKTKICSSECVPEPMGIDAHCGEDPAHPVDTRSNKFFEVKYDYLGSNDKFVQVFIHILDNKFLDVVDSHYKIEVETTHGTVLQTPNSTALSNYTNPYIKSTVMVNALDPSESSMWYEPIKEPDHFRSTMMMSLSSHTNPLTVNYPYDGNHYIMFKIFRTKEFTDGGPVNLSIAFRDDFNVYQCFSDQVMDGSFKKVANDGSIAPLPVCNQVKAELCTPEDKCMAIPEHRPYLSPTNTPMPSGNVLSPNDPSLFNPPKMPGDDRVSPGNPAPDTHYFENNLDKTPTATPVKGNNPTPNVNTPDPNDTTIPSDYVVPDTNDNYNL